MTGPDSFSSRRLDDVPSGLEHFLNAYWNQMGDEIYGDVAGAAEEFRRLEDPGAVRRLTHEISRLIKDDALPDMVDADAHARFKSLGLKDGGRIIDREEGLAILRTLL